MSENKMPNWDRRQVIGSGGAVVALASALAPSSAGAQAARAPNANPTPSPTSSAGGPVMPEIRGVHHVGVRSFDKEASKKFWCDVLGFVPHPEKDNWLGVAGSERKFIHLMPAQAAATPSARSGEDARDLANHVALEVADLKVVVTRLLQAGLKPFQADLDPSTRREIASLDRPLDFGIGTVFVTDPSGNIVEFMQRDFGIFEKIKGS